MATESSRNRLREIVLAGLIGAALGGGGTTAVDAVTGAPADRTSSFERWKSQEWAPFRQNVWIQLQELGEAVATLEERTRPGAGR